MEDARGVGVTADCVQIMLLKVVQTMAARCAVRHLVESRSKEKLCMLTTQWVASVADAPLKSKVDVIDVHGKHMHGNVSYDAKAGSRSAWKATLFAMPGFTEMTVEPLVQRFPTLRAFMQHAREVGQSRAAAELAGMSFACRIKKRLMRPSLFSPQSSSAEAQASGDWDQSERSGCSRHSPAKTRP